MHLAAADGNVMTTQKLLIHGASPNATAKDGSVYVYRLRVHV